MPASPDLKIIVTASAKGGVGKSSTCCCLAAHYASQGNAVHIIDATHKKTVTRWLGKPHSPSDLITVSSPTEPEKLDAYLSEVKNRNDSDVILIDIAGAFEQTALIAMARANFTIVPMKPNEADITEGLSLIHNAQALYSSFGKEPNYRVLITMVQAVGGGAVQEFGLQEIERLKLPRFKNVMMLRPVYAEIGVTHQPPHFAAIARGDPVVKARAEIASIAGEIEQLIAATRTLAYA